MQNTIRDSPCRVSFCRKWSVAVDQAAGSTGFPRGSFDRKSTSCPWRLSILGSLPLFWRSIWRTGALMWLTMPQRCTHRMTCQPCRIQRVWQNRNKCGSSCKQSPTVRVLMTSPVAWRMNRRRAYGNIVVQASTSLLFATICFLFQSVLGCPN